MSVQDHYQKAIGQIIADSGLESLHSAPTPIVRPNAELQDVLLHTDWYVHKIDSAPHYRFRRYRQLLDYLAVSDARETNVDIGSGAGLFSWVFLDWAADQGLEFERVGLFGFDHSSAMRDLAQLVRGKLTNQIANYPVLHYSCDVDTLLKQLTDNHSDGTGYTITLGHVLAQAHAHTPKGIENFAKIIRHICDLLGAESSCVLIASDALQASTEFTAGWDLMLGKLISAGIHCEQTPVGETWINDDRRAKLAVLSPS